MNPAQSASALTSCIACGATVLRPFGRRVGYSYARCGSCGSVQLSPVPSATELDVAYATQYAHDESAHTSFQGGVADGEALSLDEARYHDAVLDVVSATVGDAPVLEVGCGYGGLLRRAAVRGLRWRGIDTSRHAVEFCRSIGLDVQEGRLRDVHDSARAIVLCFVLEHLPDYDAFFADCRDHLIERGYVVTLHPVAEFASLMASVLRFGLKSLPLPAVDSAFKPPWHVVLPSLGGLQVAAERNGFEVHRVTPAPIGRFGGRLRRAVQSILSGVNTIGWALAKTRWPLIPAYIVVLRRSSV